MNFGKLGKTLVALVCGLSLATAAGAVPISGLPSITTPGAADQIPIVHSGTTSQITVNNLFNGFGPTSTSGNWGVGGNETVTGSSTAASYNTAGNVNATGSGIFQGIVYAGNGAGAKFSLGATTSGTAASSLFTDNNTYVELEGPTAATGVGPIVFYLGYATQTASTISFGYHNGLGVLTSTGLALGSSNYGPTSASVNGAFSSGPITTSGAITTTSGNVAAQGNVTANGTLIGAFSGGPSAGKMSYGGTTNAALYSSIASDNSTFFAIEGPTGTAPSGINFTIGYNTPKMNELAIGPSAGYGMFTTAGYAIGSSTYGPTSATVNGPLAATTIAGSGLASVAGLTSSAAINTTGGVAVNSSGGGTFQNNILVAASAPSAGKFSLGGTGTLALTSSLTTDNNTYVQLDGPTNATGIGPIIFYLGYNTATTSAVQFGYHAALGNLTSTGLALGSSNYGPTGASIAGSIVATGYSDIYYNGTRANNVRTIVGSGTGSSTGQANTFPSSFAFSSTSYTCLISIQGATAKTSSYAATSTTSITVYVGTTTSPVSYTCWGT